jgi:hypothetical protein
MEQYSSFDLFLSHGTILDLAKLMTKKERLKVFEAYREIHGKRAIERISLETGISKSNLYKYLPESESLKGGHIPDADVTAKMLDALQHGSKYRSGREIELVKKTLEMAFQRANGSSRRYYDWVQQLKKTGILDDPFSQSTRFKLEMALP